MKRLLALLAAGAALAGCTRIEPGHVGIKVSNWGSDAGVDPTPHGIGYYWTLFTGTTYYQYPVYTTNYTWSGPNDDKPVNEAIAFQDRSGLGVSADVAVAWHADPSLAPRLFQQYRLDADGITAGPLRNAVRNAIVETASDMAVEDIYGPKKAWLIEAARQKVAKQFARYGLVLDQLYWASNIRLPGTILAQINARIANEQEALAAQASVATVEAQARSRVARAEGLAKATEVEAAAIRTNPEILQQRAIEKWDGRLPTYLTAGTGLPFIGSTVR